ncbi:hypothetical protein EAD96_04445 [Micromonospora sp. BL1]|uniref:hypothetical protein n=1 Tax=Micromonospora sp. BL1 TaxID=2478709 RepID=UPI000EF5E9EB|nr:hypothetical protein [Micromonospora sp. BL1]RLQ08748.1 hypothetical protein EAD96_04445 [Micromonospora sp. BL1]
MPNLDFYAAEDDWSAVLEALFDLGLFRVFESDSEPDCELREFSAAAEVAAAPRGRHLALFVVGCGPAPIARRIDRLPGLPGGPTFRYCCEGWGLVQLYYGGPVGAQEVRWSHSNHNSEKRASAWATAVPRLGDPAAWNWAAVTSASGRLNRVIRRMAVSKIGSRPVLPHAAQFIADAGLRYEYGMGIHATPPYGTHSSR